MNFRRIPLKSIERNLTSLKQWFGNSQTAQLSNTKFTKITTALHQSSATSQDIEQFKATFPEIVDYLTNVKYFENIEMIRDLYKEMIEYNIGTGKNIRGLMIVVMYKALEDRDNLTEEKLKMAHVVGWCSEIFTGFAFVLDDIVDRSDERRGKPCWYKRNDIGMNAINHMMVLENAVYYVLKKYVGHADCYLQTMELFHQTVFNTFAGQTLEGTLLKDGKPQLDSFSLKRYNTLTYHKTGYGTFYSPVILAAYLTGKYTKSLEARAQYVAAKLGPLYQAHNDMMDCFGNELNNGNTGTDISEGKCTWLIVQALNKAMPSQKGTVAKYYGQPGIEATNRIRTLYEDLDLRSCYLEYERRTLKEVSSYLNENKDDATCKALLNFWKLQS